MGIERCCLDGWIGARIGAANPTIEAVRRYQLIRLQTVLRYAAARSPFYAARLGGLTELGRFSDFERIPPLTAADLTENGNRLLCVEQERVCRVFTSGTTGAPKRLCFTKEELSATVDYFTAGSRQFLKPGDRALLLFDSRAENGAGQLFTAAAARLRVLATPYGIPPEGAAGCRAVRRARPSLVLAAPDTARAMLACGEEAAFDTLLLSGDGLLPGEREAFESRFRCRVFQQYGLTESAFGLGVDCKAFCGYHLREPDYYVEIVGADGTTLPAGETGRVVITSLICGAMPLVRYDTGDRGRYLPEPCPCGSELPLLDRVRPRNVQKGYRRE